MEFAISQSKWCNCRGTKSKYIDWSQGLTCDHRVWPWPWPWPWMFNSNMEFPISLPKMAWLPRNEKKLYRLNSRPQIWPADLTLTMTLTLDFQGQIWNLLYLNHKCSDCHETRSKHIDWTPGLKCDQWVDFGHDFDIWVFKVKCDLDHLVTNVRYKEIPDSDRGDFRCRRAVDSFSWFR